MTPQPKPQRGSYRSALALLVLFVQTPAHAEETSVADPLIVSALRIPRDPATVTSAVTVLDPLELKNLGIYQLRDALNLSPGVISTSTGGETGAIGALFIRGTTTAYSLMVVDGVRISDSTTPLGNILSASRTYDVGSIELLRGPQGAIFGGESIGGVIWLETPHGSGDLHGSATVEAGSFHSLAAHSMVQGQTGDLSYYLSGGYEETDNDGPSQDFHQFSTALRVEGKINSSWTLGTTYRANVSYFNDSGNSDNYFDSQLATVYATGKISDLWMARFNAGYQQEFYDNDSFFGNYGTDLRAGSISTDHEFTLAENVRLLAGAFFNRNSFQNTNAGIILNDTTRIRYGAYSVLEWDATDHLTTTAALRWEDYDAYGDELTWRIGSIYHITTTDTSIRGGIGTSFRSPSYLDLYGSFGAGNPNLKAESAIGWDLGVEQKIGSHHTAEVTWFHNKITDQIQSFPTPPVNIPGDSITNGLEVGLRGSWLENALNYRLAWTYLHESLSDQPKNAATASVDWKPTAKSLIGIGATHLSAHSWGGSPIDSYTVARLYGSYQLTEKIKLNARLENALNENYELSSFFGTTIKGAGTGLYAGITVDW